MTTYAALAFFEGALKYGTWNWRAAGARASVYVHALERHLVKWWNGQYADPKTGVPHLASILACVGILIDAELVSKLVDDRPPPAPVDQFLERSEAILAQLRGVFGACSPRHYTIADVDAGVTQYLAEKYAQADAAVAKFRGNSSPSKKKHSSTK